MLSKKHWLWCAEHHKGISWIISASSACLWLAYFTVFVDRVFVQSKFPDQVHSQVSQMEKFGCNSYEVGEMFIPSRNKMIALNGDLKDYVPDPLERADARLMLLENYPTKIFGSEILDLRPDCLGAFIADKNYLKSPYAILIVDRATGKVVFRIARLYEYLTR